MGEYYQYVGSMHIYTNFLEGVSEYLAEGHQKIVEMPPMPFSDPFAIAKSRLPRIAFDTLSMWWRLR